MRKILPIICGVLFMQVDLVGVVVAASSAVQTRKTLAIADFANNSKNDTYSALGKGLADMLITDLSNVSAFQIVERKNLEKLINELKLGETIYIDPATAQKVGKVIGAEYMLVGAITSVEPEIRLDARIIEVGSAKIVRAEQVSGKSDTFFALEKKLADKLIQGLSVKITTTERLSVHQVATKDFQAILHYSNAIAASDAGNAGMAQQELRNALSKDAQFGLAAAKLKEMLSSVKQYGLAADLADDQWIKDVNDHVDTINITGDLVSRALSIYQSKRRFADGVAFFDRLISLKDNLDLSVEGNSWLLYCIYSYASSMADQRGDFEKAVKYRERYIQENPGSMYVKRATEDLERYLQDIPRRQEERKKLLELTEKVKSGNITTREIGDGVPLFYYADRCEDGLAFVDKAIAIGKKPGDSESEYDKMRFKLVNYAIRMTTDRDVACGYIMRYLKETRFPEGVNARSIRETIQSGGLQCGDGGAVGK